MIRLGALGDGIQASAVLPYLARDGYRITMNGSPGCLEVLKHNPYIKETIEHERDSIPLGKLDEHWEELSKGYDKVVNLTSTVENDYLFCFPQDGYYKCLNWRRKMNKGVNYFENQLAKGGYKANGRPVRGEIYFSFQERLQGHAWRKEYKDYFVILWALSGSSIQKAYRWYEEVSNRLLNAHSDMMIVTSGDYACKLLTYERERMINLPQQEKSFRYSMLLAKYADLVVGPETGLLNAAGCLSTPKICFLTHSSKENLTKHWENDYSMQADTYCSPCHLIHKYKGIWKNHCMVTELGWPKCTDSPSIGDLIQQIEEIYYARKERTRKAA